MTNILNSYKNYLKSFFVPIVILSIIWVSYKISPFGNRNLLVSDLGTQYIPFLTSLRDQLLHGHLNFYWTSLGLGDNSAPLVSYYLLSPLNSILLFSKAKYIPTMISILIFFKIGLMSVTFDYCLRKTNNVFAQSWLFSTVYSLSGFVAMNFYNIMWLDAMIWLPLVVVGMTRFFDEGKRKLLIFSLVMTIVSNYYLGYMTVLFSCCYFVVDLYKNYWRNYRIRIINYIKTLLQVTLLMSFLLFPTFVGMQETAKTAIKWYWFIPLPQFGLSFFNQLGIASNNFNQRLVHGPTIFVGSLVIFLVVLYLRDKRICERCRRADAMLLVILFLSMWFLPFNTIWHMMNRPAGFPYRNSFFFSFVCIMIAAKKWKSGFEETEKKLLYRTEIIFLPLFVVSWTIDSSHHLLALTTIVMSVLMYRALRQKNKNILILLTLIELTLNFYGAMSKMQLGNQDNYEKVYDSVTTLTRRLNEKDRGIFERITEDGNLLTSAYTHKYNGYNDGLLFNFNGVSSYASTLDKAVRRSLNSLGYYSKNERRISAKGGTELSNTLLAIKYRMIRKNNKLKVVNNKYFKGNTFLFSEKAIGYNSRRHTIWQNQEFLANQMIGGKNSLFRNVSDLRSYQEEKALNIKATTSGILYYEKGGKKIYRIGYVVKNHRYTINEPYFSKKSLKTKYFRILNLNKLYNVTEKTPSFKYQKDKIMLTSKIRIEDSRKKLLVFSIPYNSGWKAYRNGHLIKTHKVLNSLIGVSLAKGVNQIELKYKTPGLESGIIISLGTFIWIMIEENKDWKLKKYRLKNYQV